MSEMAIFETAEALRVRVGEAVGGVGQVHAGPPLRNEVQQSKVSLFLFHVQVNAALRNELHRASPPPLEPASEPSEQVDALPLDLRFLISVFRTPDASVTPPNELTTLGQIVRVLQARPTLAGESLGGQVVRVTPDPYSMEELSRVWGLFPQDVYRTSMVYLASPVFVEAGAVPAGAPVRRREQRSGLASEPPDLLGQPAEEV